MAKVTYTVNDDSGQLGSGGCDITATSYTFGTLSGNYNNCGFRFTGVAVANAATIRKATLKLHFTGISTSTGTFTIKIEDADNAAALATTTNDLTGRTYSATTLATARIHDQADGDFYFDVTALVQAIINRAGWASGNAINLVITGAWTGTSATVGTTEGSNPAKLTIIHGGNATGFTTFGSNTGSFTNPTNANADDGTIAILANSTNGTHTFYNFGFSIASTDVIDDVVVKANLDVTSTSAKSRFGMEISTDGGTSWATQKFTNQIGITQEDVYWSGDDTGWSISLSPSLINDNTNFRIRIQHDFASGTNDSELDYIAVAVYSTTGATVPSRASWGQSSNLPIFESIKVIAYSVLSLWRRLFNTNPRQNRGSQTTANG